MSKTPGPGPSPIVAVVGPTAVGKSDLGVELALRLGGEVVNADSMQLYKGMDIGTAKLTLEEQGGVPHHLLDVWEVTTDASVADYQARAHDVIGELRARGRTPIVVGGSGLYVSAALDALEFPGTDPVVRLRWDAELEKVGPAELHRQLAERDPEAAAGILPSNGRRIVRALEVVELRGSYSSTLPAGVDGWGGAVVRIGLTSPRDVLDARVESRVDRMWEAGLVDEVRGLSARGLSAVTTAGRALGYKQVLAFLVGEISEVEARDETVRATRRFVRRQESWFRRDPTITWHDADTVEPARLAAEIDATVR